LGDDLWAKGYCVLACKNGCPCFFIFAGLKIFELTDPQNLSVADSIAGVNCNDVIASNGFL
jgi:hypothetical protein